jgi:hypothetical protein
VTEQPTAPPADDAADAPRHNAGVPHATPERPISAVARQALEEAAARRAAAAATELPPEDGGPRGPEPTRYGDWEKKGLAIDF